MNPLEPLTDGENFLCVLVALFFWVLVLVINFAGRGI